jgi:ABC-type transport system involved in cytochrome c biogenesis permease subunit
MYSVSLPYRLSLRQYELLRISADIQVLAPLVALITGTLAARAGKDRSQRSRVLGFFGLTLSAAVLALAILTVHAHSAPPHP